MNVMYCFVGCFVGTLIGVLPGIGPIATISILFPLTFQISSTSAIIMLCSIFYGAMYGGSTSSILVNIPGEAASVVTCLDGYQMARNGRAGVALGISAIASFIAGTISTVGLTVFSPALVALALKFGPPEFFSVMVVGFVATLFMVGGSMIKAVLTIGFGLMISTIGMDPVKGMERFTFGSVELTGGLGLVPVIVGMFGVSELLTT
jgi:putative tricarboxylic transport membrane protein